MIRCGKRTPVKFTNIFNHSSEAYGQKNLSEDIFTEGFRTFSYYRGKTNQRKLFLLSGKRYTGTSIFRKTEYILFVCL